MIVLIFDLKIKRWGYEQIAAHLNATGIPSTNSEKVHRDLEIEPDFKPPRSNLRKIGCGVTFTTEKIKTLAPTKDALNNAVNEKLKAAPNEARNLEKRLGGLEREIRNFVNFIVTNGDSSSSIRDALTFKEDEKRFARINCEFFSNLARPRF